MNLVDSSGWLSFFAGDRNAAKFAEPIGKSKELVVPSITITEVFKSIALQRDEESALTAIAHMMEASVIPLDAELAINAADAGLQHRLPLADSIIFTTAQKYQATIWTQDADFKGLAGCQVFCAKILIFRVFDPIQYVKPEMVIL